jgi:hypothetical protein
MPKKYIVEGTIEIPFRVEVDADEEAEAENKAIYQVDEEYNVEGDTVGDRSPYIWVNHIEEVEEDDGINGW